MVIRSSPQPSRWLGPGEVARRLGISIKALRVYEAAGLVTPDRREGGWRHYGPGCIERLRRLLALKALGLSLAEVRELLEASGTTSSSILDLQAGLLVDELAAMRERLERIRRAQRELAETGQLTTGALLDLSSEAIPKTPMTPKRVVALIKAMANGVDLKPGLSAILERAATHGVAEADMEAQLATIVAEASSLAIDGDSGSPKALALAERWLALEAVSGLDLARPNDLQLRGFADDVLSSRALAPTLTFLRAAVGRARASSTSRREA